MSLYDIKPFEYNNKLAEALSQIQEFKMPEWAFFVKTSTHKERPPAENNWWYKRAASILRQLYIKEIVGVNRLRTRYGGRKDRGSKPEQFRKSGGKIIRTILQQAEAAGFVEKVKEKKAGRKLTEKGKKFLDSIEGEKENKIEEEMNKTTDNAKNIKVEKEKPEEKKKENLVEGAENANA